MPKVRRDKNGVITAYILNPRPSDKLLILHEGETWADEPGFVPPQAPLTAQLTLDDLLKRIEALEKRNEPK